MRQRRGHLAHGGEPPRIGELRAAARRAAPRRRASSVEIANDGDERRRDAAAARLAAWSAAAGKRAPSLRRASISRGAPDAPAARRRSGSSVARRDGRARLGARSRRTNVPAAALAATIDALLVEDQHGVRETLASPPRAAPRRDASFASAAASRCSPVEDGRRSTAAGVRRSRANRSTIGSIDEFPSKRCALEKADRAAKPSPRSPPRSIVGYQRVSIRNQRTIHRIRM